MLTFVAKSVAGFALGGVVGLVVVLAVEAIDELDLHELALPGTVGLLLAGGIVLVFGPAALIPAILIGVAAGAIVAALVHQRRLTDEEYNFVNRVFHGTLDRDRILLTNLVGESDRAFTIPGPGGTILVNIGAGEADPIRYTGHGGAQQGIRAPGQLLVHELVHAWQIEHSHFIPGLMCNGISNQVGTLGGNMDVYTYGPATVNFDEFNLEQQGSIVDEWFAGTAYAKQQGTFDPMLRTNKTPTGAISATTSARASASGSLGLPKGWVDQDGVREHRGPCVRRAEGRPSQSAPGSGRSPCAPTSRSTALPTSRPCCPTGRCTGSGPVHAGRATTWGTGCPWGGSARRAR